MDIFEFSLRIKGYRARIDFLIRAPILDSSGFQFPLKRWNCRENWNSTN